MTAGPRDVAALVAAIEPYDDAEHAHQADVLAWLASTPDVYRRVVALAGISGQPRA